MLETSIGSSAPWCQGGALAGWLLARGDVGLTRERDEAFVLGTRELGEADLIVTLLTERHGKLRAVARAARRSRRRFGGLLEPLTRVRASWSGREGRDLQRLDGLDGVRSFAAMQAEPLRQAACAVLAEVASCFSHEGQADPEEFRLLGAVLEALEQGGPPRLLLRYFEYWTLKVHGLLPDLEGCALCGAPLVGHRPVRVSRGRGPLCEACPRLADEREATLGAADRAFLVAARKLGPAALGRAKPDLRAGRGLELLLRGTLEAFAERSFRTYRHFRAAEHFPVGGDQK
jgi:DNA repair protein RecO (recombination protein O)